MEKSFATLDTEAGSSTNDCLNSTALNEDGNLFVPPKTPQRDDIKISPIPKEGGQSAFHKRMAQFKSRGESPLSKPKSRGSSLLEASRNSNDFESGYNSHAHETASEAALESSSKENYAYKTPKRQNQSYLKNPFETRLLENIHTSTLSPNLLEIYPSPKDKPWSIDHLSILCPANITDEDIRMSRSVIDPEFEEKIHRQLEIYWESGVGYVPSPEGPRPVIFESPAAMSVYSSTTSTRKDSPAARPPLARRKTITLRNCKVQTDLTIPSSADLDIAKILGEKFMYQEDNPESPEDEFNISLNTSLPRRLFSDTSFMDESFIKEADEDGGNIREDLGNSVVMQSADVSPVKPSTLRMKLMTHNFLSSKFLKNVASGYPLKLNCSAKEEKECEFDNELLCATLKKIDYGVLRGAALDIGEGNNLPETLPGSDSQKLPQELKNELHRLIFCVDIIDGDLECPETGRKFPIKDGIPNMLCSETELQ